jgi:hypothetical protein
MWSPQRKAMPEQCASCPFGEDNDDEWLAVCRKLARDNGMDPDEVNHKEARLNIHIEVSERGDFGCHTSAYDVKTMKLRDSSEIKQCPGATAHFKSGRLV